MSETPSEDWKFPVTVRTRLDTPEAQGAVFSVVYAGLRNYFAAHPGELPMTAG